MKSNFKKLPWRSKHYLEWMKQKSCCVCHRPGPSDPHHFQRPGEGSMSSTVGDDRALPVCRFHHTLFHNHGRAKWAEWCLDPEWLVIKYQESYTRETGREVKP